ncbi:MAG TPA: tRNA pseudouridine(55) synthase TruB [Rickettsia endosymbiont of Pyrocoelia pectoralis]|nr:tRNA pseudouridine(55) synthase TruB [Rickettsia endosymbiont of Pyrocoelia pectoralis]
MEGYWLNIYKPRGISSAKAVSMVKKILGNVKIGHSGTLDVEAEGVLPLAIGEATKLVQMLIDAKKAYIFTMQFGKQTDSGDYAGTVIATNDHIPSKEDAYSIISKFIGNVTQTPSAFSALKVNGVRAYKLAREGKPVELKSREITIYDLKCLDYDAKNKTATYYTECSKGTYIRTLAEDLALSLQSLAFVIELRRTQVGIFTEANAIRINSPDDLNKTSLEEQSIKIEAILDDILVLDATEEQAQKIKYGQKCLFDYDKDVNLLWIRHKGKLLAIGSLSNTADTSKVGSQISGEPAERILIHEHRRIPKFDVPNLEVSKVYKSCFNSLRVFNL